MLKLKDSSRTSEPNSAQRQAVTAKLWSSQQQRRAAVAVHHASVVHARPPITGTGNTCVGGSGGRLAVKTLQNVNVVDVDRANATDKVTHLAANNNVCNEQHVLRYVNCRQGMTVTTDSSVDCGEADSVPFLSPVLHVYCECDPIQCNATCNMMQRQTDNQYYCCIRV